MITRAKLSTIEQGLPKYRSMLAGNDAFNPFAFFNIANVSGDGSSQTLTLSSIPQTYTHLQIRGIVRNTRTSLTNGNLSIYFNGTEGTNADHGIRNDGGTAASYGNTGITALTIGATAQDSNTAGIYTAFIIDILNYSSSGTRKVVKSVIGTNRNGTSDNVGLTSASQSATTNAITSITFANYNGVGFTTLSNFALYGIKGS